MTIVHQLLGAPFQDNALFVKVDTGQKVYRLLFDCGENTISQLSAGEIMKIDHLFLSHFHLDHVAGLDHFIRLNYNRAPKAVHIWGPAESATKIFNRLNSFSWNLIEDSETQWVIHEVSAEAVDHYVVSAVDQFRTMKHIAAEPHSGVILSLPEFQVSMLLLDHRIPVLGFKLLEQDREKVSNQQLKAFNLQPGPWIQTLLDRSLADQQNVRFNGSTYRLRALREQLLFKVKGESLVYLTDFLLTEEQRQGLTDWLKGVKIMYCESQYLNEDMQLAQNNYHLTVGQAARLALEADVQQLFIFHFSQRYKHLPPERFLQQARTIFKATALPVGWASEAP